MAKKITNEDVPTKRLFVESNTIHHDLYKFEMSKCKKDVGWDGNPQVVEVEHVHFFHTVDSDGKKQNTSTYIASHFHLVDIIEQGEGLPPIVKCKSGPMKWVQKRIKGQIVKVAEPVKVDGEIDDHTHEVTYKISNELKIRQTVTEAAVIISQEAQKGAPIPGVMG